MNTKHFQNGLLVVAVLAVCFNGIFNHELWTPDEPRVAAIALEMSRSGDIVIPRLAGEPFIEKPPLYFAIAAAFLRLAGPWIGNTASIRLVSALFGIGTLLMVYFLGKCLVGSRFAFLSVIVLGTMIGFVENFHWIRVDPALSFFIAGAVWCFAEGYIGRRMGFMIPAGLLCACAFLTKGLIGPLLVAIPWSCFFFFALWDRRNEPGRKPAFWLPQAIGFTIFLAFSGAWIILLKVSGGEELWNEWFWVNHVGRLSGSAVGKGHIRSGGPLYYLQSLAIYGMPWLPLIGVWFVRIGKKFGKRKRLDRTDILLLVWGIGSILFLSISSTKRGIYLAPILPAFSFMVARILSSPTPTWMKTYSAGGTIGCTVLIGLLAVLPFVDSLWIAFVPPAMASFLQTPGTWTVVALVGVILCILLINRLKKDSSFFFTTAAGMAILYICLFSGPMKAFDEEKSMKHKIEAFIDQIPVHTRASIAGWDFSETMQGIFYYYRDWKVPQLVKEDRLASVINGRDQAYDAVLLSEFDTTTEIVSIPHQILLHTNVGGFGHSRNIALIKGSHSSKEK